LIVGQRLRVGYRGWVPKHDDVFEGFEGEGEDRRAKFRSVEDGSKWEAYRYNGRWVVGSSADPARLYPPTYGDVDRDAIEI
jgi:hypothetical protein